MSNYSMEVLNITKMFPGVIANNNISFGIKQGEVHGLIGENGAGKSTILKILSGLYPFGSYTGKIILENEEVNFNSPHDAHMKGIGFVPQEINILENLSVAENIYVNNFSVERKAFINFKKIEDKAASLLMKNGINLDPRVKASQLSVGQKQLLMIARVLSRNPKVLILDEPTSSLSQQDVAILITIIEKLKRNKVSIIFVTHRLDEIIQFTDTVSILRDGAYISQYRKEDYDRDRIVSDMVGRSITTFYPARKVSIGEEVFRVENLTVEHPRIAGRNIIEDISFSLRRGEVLGIAGLVGAGRTEIIETIYGIRKYQKGKIYKNGKEVLIKDEQSALSNNLSFVTEDRAKSGILFNADIKRNISISNLKAISSRSFINKDKETARADVQFKRMNVKAPDLKTMVINLSGGNIQKIVLGRALNTEPDILLLDEPTKGIDVGAKHDIYKIINGLAANGKAVIMVSSELPELMGMCDNFVVIAKGKVVKKFSRDEANELEIIKAAT